mmetsp:Transcript_6696/g.16476  ORF Transcript_6696/g.16476 Transcript_6696/m.16476 type:complete len:268 (+) Transcript_6696:2-805(+)
MEQATLERAARLAQSRGHGFLQPFLEEATAFRSSADKDKVDKHAHGERTTPRQYLLGELVVTDKDGKTLNVLTLQPGREFNVGRSRRADIIFSNPFVSSIHCKVSSSITTVPNGESVNLVQLQPRLTDVSSNGTFINGDRVTRHETVTLNCGDVISVVRPSAPDDASAVGYVIYRHRASPLLREDQALADLGYDASGNDTEGAGDAERAEAADPDPQDPADAPADAGAAWVAQLDVAQPPEAGGDEGDDDLDHDADDPPGQTLDEAD